MRKPFYRYAWVALLLVWRSAAGQVFPGASWEERTPEEVGMHPDLVQQFVSALGGDGVLVRNGYLVRSWGGHTSRSDWASAAKPVISTLLFMAIEEGRVASVDSLTRPVVQSHLSDDLIAKDQAMTWRHLADMTSGYARGEAPGEAWAYNDTAIQLYSILLFDGVYGDTSDNVAMSRLAALQFEDGGVFGSRSGRGVNASPRDFARIGWLWVNRGNWNGTQLIPQSYFDNHMQSDVPPTLPRTSAAGSDYLGVGSFGGGTDQTHLGPGIYGFNWWFNSTPPGGGMVWPGVPADAFQANGHWNIEVMTMIPSLGIVAACRGSWGTFDPNNPDASMNQRIKLLVDAAQSGPLPGQIIVDPDNPAWLIRSGGDPVFIVGPGDPEDFLYRGTRNPDGTRTGDQGTLIDKLISNGGNSIYMQIVRSHGGDGPADHNPFLNSDPGQGLSSPILDQWETWFSHMDDNGIVIYLFFYDDGARIWNTGDNVGAAECDFFTSIVNRFEHHRNLIWVIGEESEEAYSHVRVRSLAQLIQDTDDHQHVIANHHLSGLTFKAWEPGSALSQFAIQYNQSTPGELHDGMVTAFLTANGNYNLNMSESASYGTGASMRLKNWASALGGAYVMALGMDIANTATQDLAWCRIQQEFFESTDYTSMAPHDELAHGQTRWVLANPGTSYIAYADNAAGDLGLAGLPPGTYQASWVDCVSGDVSTQADIAVAGGDTTFATPAGLGTELAVWINRTGSVGNIPPTANPQDLWVEQPNQLAVTLTYSDPDGPGPYSFQILSGPDHGDLTGTSADRVYTPDPGFAGTDSFDFLVNDGADDSLPATVTIVIDPASNQPPAAADQQLSTRADTPLSIQLTYSDPDGPGPYQVTITDPPAHGDLTGSDNDRIYTPAPGWTGNDLFTWRVNDGLADSNQATISIDVQPEPDGGIDAGNDGGQDAESDHDDAGSVHSDGPLHSGITGDCGCGGDRPSFGSGLLILLSIIAIKRKKIAHGN